MDTFLGLGPNGWQAIVGGAYARATLMLAWWTNKASLRAAEAARDVARDQIAASFDVARKQIEASNKAVVDQIDASTKAVADQIAASADTQERQLEGMRGAALIQARVTSVSNNRQEWINALRDEVTGFLTDADMAVVVRDEMPISDERAQEQFRSARALTAHIFKVRLLINPTEGESTNLVELLQEAQREGLSSQHIVIQSH